MVNAWTLNDGSTTVSFAVNPFDMGSPNATKNLDVSTAQAQTVMNPAKAATWNLNGYVYSDTEHDKLVLWHRKDLVLVLTDHLLRSWDVISVDLDITDRKPTPKNSSRYQYTWQLLVLGRHMEESS